MKHLRFVFMLIASLLLWGCLPGITPTPEAPTPIPDTPTPSAPTATPLPIAVPSATLVEYRVFASGDPNAAINCQTGKPLDSKAPAVLGIGAASLEHVGDQAVVTFNFPRTNDLVKDFAATRLPYFGGIGFIDPKQSPPQPDPTWFFDSTENSGYNWQFNPSTHGFTGSTVYFKDGKWTQGSEPAAAITANGSNLIVKFPWSDVAGSFWYVSATDQSQCTSLGLGPDSKPMLPMPAGVSTLGPTIVRSPTVPAPTGLSITDLQIFATNLSEALKVNNTPFLFVHLDPAVVNFYGADQCQLHFSQRKADPTTKIQVLNVNGSGPWSFTMDTGSLQIPLVYTLTADVTQQGVLTQTLIHFGVNGNQLDWFTKCSASSQATSTPTP